MAEVEGHGPLSKEVDIMRLAIALMVGGVLLLCVAVPATADESGMVDAFQSLLWVDRGCGQDPVRDAVRATARRPASAGDQPKAG